MATAQDNSVALTGNSLIDGLLQGSSWNFGIGARTLSYSLSVNDNPGGGAWTAGLQSAISTAFQAWSNVANISFAVYGSGGVYTSSPADIAVILTGNEIQSGFPGAIALGIFPSPSFANTLLATIGESRASYPNPEGDIALDNYHYAYSYLAPGGIGLLTMLHEIGHALGLKHTGDDGGNSRPTFASLGISNLDNNNYTVMSYTDAQGNAFGTNFASGNATTPMPLDILAIQQIYGPNNNSHTGDDPYSLQPDGTVRTIWDAGGTDTIDASSAQYPVTIDLRAGALSTTTSSKLAIAYNVVIENAVGGNAGDSILGNDANNRIDGGGGSDSMSGGLGDDTYIINDSSDQIVESQNGGTDTAQVSSSYTLPSNVENASVAPGANVSLQGNDLGNVLTGNNAYSTLSGGFGNDRLIDGSGGHGRLIGGAGDDTFVVGSSSVQAPSLTLSGTTGSPIVGNSTLVLTSATGTFYTQLYDWNTDGEADTVYLYYQDANLSHFFGAWFSTRQLGSNLSPGQYDNAERASSASPGHAGMDIYGDGVGFNQLFGNFTIFQVEIDSSSGSPVLSKFLASFEQHGESPSATPIFGTIAYGDIQQVLPTAVIELDGEGHDTVYSAGPYSLPSAVEDLILNGNQPSSGVGNAIANSILGTSFADSLSGEGGDDTLAGNDGNDVLTGGSGRDVIRGGSGIDASSYATSGTQVIASTTTSVAVDWRLGEGSWVDAGNAEVLESIENLEGGAGNDALYGDAGANALDGNGGNDQLYGLAGDDQLMGGDGRDFLQGAAGNDIVAGGLGNDTLAGGIGADSFRFDTLPNTGANLDTVADFTHTIDQVVLEHAVFTAFATPGALPSGSFTSGAGLAIAADANDYVIYDTTTGAVFYDSDGNGIGLPVQFATLSGHPLLAATDFLIV